MKVNDPKPAPSGLKTWMKEQRARVDTGLDRHLPPADTRPDAVHSAMRYATLNGGKRLRALLTLATCEAFSGDDQAAFQPALALELFHASTLVHDDLPCMDDDELRRGQPSTHIVFGEANALLAGNALLTLAFEWMANASVSSLHPTSLLVSELARAGGSEGVIGGQVEDLIAEHAPPDENRLLYIHTEKTARLIACACRAGAICAGAKRDQANAIGDFGLNVGLAFQILDDVLDATQSTETLGKPAGSDADRGKLTSVALWGLEKSRQEAERYTQQALDILPRLDAQGERLHELTQWLYHRNL